MLVVPEPGFVFKTKEVSSDTKFFVNVTSHPVVDKPDQKEMVDQDENQQTVRIPMSVGNVREDFDQSKLWSKCRK